jgi:hypothetical protein
MSMCSLKSSCNYARVISLTAMLLFERIFNRMTLIFLVEELLAEL